MLEPRTLLSVTAQEYAAIRSGYVDFALPADMGQVNIIEVTADQLSVAGLKDAIAGANSTTLHDLIVVRTTDTQNAIAYTSAADELAIDIPDTQGAITIVGFGTRPLTLDGAQQSRVLSVGSPDSTATVNLGRLTLINGLTTGNGGGIYQSGGTLRLENATISGNVASSASSNAFGGGMCQDGGTLALTNVTISGNTASTGGGGIVMASGISILTNVRISGNVASSPLGDWFVGGGVYQSGGTSTLTNVTISGNTVGGNAVQGTGASGAGMYQVAGTSTLTNVTISGNAALGDSAAGHSDGGGLGLVYCVSTLTNVVISGNTASSTGGGAALFGSTTTLTNATICGNTALAAWPSSGGGGVSLGGPGMTTLHNTVIAKNTGVQEPDILAHTNSFSASNTLVGARSFLIGVDNGSNGNLVGSTNRPIDPKFASMTGSDWTQWDLRLRADSPAVNAGNNAWIPTGVTTDIAGRPRISGGTVDMGAYEFSIPATPTNLASKAFSANQINLTWTDNADSETGFQIDRATDAGFTQNLVSVTIPADSTSYSATGLAQNTTYYFRVAATGAINSPFATAVHGMLRAGDATLDGQVDLTDLSILAGNWQQAGKTLADGDFNGDGVVDLTDLSILAGQWQTPAPAPLAAAATETAAETEVVAGDVAERAAAETATAIAPVAEAAMVSAEQGEVPPCGILAPVATSAADAGPSGPAAIAEAAPASVVGPEGAASHTPSSPRTDVAIFSNNAKWRGIAEAALEADDAPALAQETAILFAGDARLGSRVTALQHLALRPRLVLASAGHDPRVPLMPFAATTSRHGQALPASLWSDVRLEGTTLEEAADILQ